MSVDECSVCLFTLMLSPSIDCECPCHLARIEMSIGLGLERIKLNLPIAWTATDGEFTFFKRFLSQWNIISPQSCHHPSTWNQRPTPHAPKNIFYILFAASVRPSIRWNECINRISSESYNSFTFSFFDDVSILPMTFHWHWHSQIK